MICQFCQKKTSQYSCPRCNATYCSLPCYQSLGHLECSEAFYKDCVEKEIALVGPDGDKSNLKKTYEMLQKMKDDQNEDLEDDGLDSDDDEDLAERLEGIDLEDSDAVWNKLSAQERAEFEAMCASGQIQELVPEYTPWWEIPLKPGKLIQDLSDASIDKFPEHLPKIDLDKIPRMKSLLGDKAPSDVIKFSLLNVLYSYAYAMRYFQGLDSKPDFANMCLEVSASLADGQNFDSAEMAVEAAASKANQNPEISLGTTVCRSVKKDVFNLVRGPTVVGYNKNLFILCALSELKEILKDAIKVNKKGKDKDPVVGPTPPWQGQPGVILDKSKVKKVLMKVDFYMSWASEYYKEYEKLYSH